MRLGVASPLRTGALGLFGMNKFQILWELGTPMPADLPNRIVEAMELGGQGATAL